MRITYVLESTELCGGVKVVFQHAELLRRRGHEVTVAASDTLPRWSGFRGHYCDLRRDRDRLTSQDLVIATYFTTIATAEELALGPIVHFCQGYEGSLPHLADQLPVIEACYRRPYPALVIAPHLGAMIHRRFGKFCQTVSPPLDPLFFSRWRLGPRRRPWIAIPGIFEAVTKQVAMALRAVVHLKEIGLRPRVLRYSSLPLSQQERQILEPARYFVQAHPRVVARHIRHCDLLLFPPGPEEGFGLPLLEALQSGVPAVCSDIPSVRHILADCPVPRIAVGDALAMAQQAQRLLSDKPEWHRIRKAGLERCQAFREDRVVNQLEAAVTHLVTYIRNQPLSRAG